MKAVVEGWKLWGAEQEYPVLRLYCSQEELEDTEALKKLHLISKSLGGLGYQRTLASINNPDALPAQGTSFVVDIGTLLALVSNIATEKSKLDTANFTAEWLRSLAESHGFTKQKKKVDEDLRCRCGQVLKNGKIYKAHQKICTVIARDFGLIVRTKESLRNLTKPFKKGKKHGKETSKSKRLRQDHEASKLSSKVSARSKRKSKRK